MKKIGQDWSSVNTMQSRVEVGMKVTLSPVNIGAEMVAAKGCGKLPWSGWLRCLVQCRCMPPSLPSSLEPMFQSATTTNNPFFQTLVKTTFPTKFFARGTLLLPSTLPFEKEHTLEKLKDFLKFRNTLRGVP